MRISRSRRAALGPELCGAGGKLTAIRQNCAPVAGKSTLNRLEHTPKRNAAKYHKINYDAAPIEALLVVPVAAPWSVPADVPPDAPAKRGLDVR